jgi:hypothetical protein
VTNSGGAWQAGRVSRRRPTAPWAATSMPEMRRQWCNAIDAVANVTFDSYDVELPPNAPAQLVASRKRIERMKIKLAEAAAVMKTESRALRGAALYWVTRDMVDVVLDAARSLPEWIPGLAAPAPTGLLCWAKSAGTVPYGKPLPDHVRASLNEKGYTPRRIGETKTVDIPWDALCWWTRPDGALQLQPASRDVKHAGMLANAKTTSPLWAAHTILLDPRVPRTDETQRTEHAHPFVSAAGAAWLLMAQANVTETRTIGPAPQPQSPPPANADSEVPTASRNDPPPVTIIELRAKPNSPDREVGDPGRTYSHRWQVSGHWRQQPCGPNSSLRQPRYITEYVKGPEGTPLITKERVHVLRK